MCCQDVIPISQSTQLAKQGEHPLVELGSEWQTASKKKHYGCRCGLMGLDMKGLG